MAPPELSKLLRIIFSHPLGTKMSILHLQCIKRFGFAVLLLSAVSNPGVCANAQQTVSGSDDRGIQLYRQGDFQGASKALKLAVDRQKNDIRAWHYLGLALSQLGKKSDARKAHERAARTADILLTSSLGRSATPPREQLLEAADSADWYLALSSGLSKKTQEGLCRGGLLRKLASDKSPICA